MTHQQVWPILDQFLDGALAAPDRWSVSAHLSECPDCREYVRDQALLRETTHAHVLSIATPEDLPARLHAALAGASQSAAPSPAVLSPSKVMRLASVVGPALAALWLMAFVIAPTRGDASLLPVEVAMAHSLFAHDESMLDVSGDGDTVRGWLWAKAEMDVATPQISGYELAGSRLLVVGGAPAAQLVYESQPGEKYLSLLRYQSDEMSSEGNPDAGGLVATRIGDISVVSWQGREWHTVLVASLPSSELLQIAAAVRESEFPSA